MLDACQFNFECDIKSTVKRLDKVLLERKESVGLGIREAEKSYLVCLVDKFVGSQLYVHVRLSDAVRLLDLLYRMSPVLQYNLLVVNLKEKTMAFLESLNVAGTFALYVLISSLSLAALLKLDCHVSRICPAF